MGKNKETKKASKSKINVLLDNVRKRNLKVVLYKNKYIHNEGRNKDELIETLLHEKKKVLKLHQSTDNNLHSEDENNIHKDEISRVLEREKKSIFSNNDSDSDESAPVEILEANKKWKEQQKVIFPAIPKKEINALLSILSSDKSFSDYENNLNACLAHMHTTVIPFWNSPSCIMKAIRDCILRRKWNNLTHILLMLINAHSPKLRPFIRHMCQVLNKFHPVIEQNGLQNQLDIVHEAHKSVNEK